jgi:hypothetical protein
LKQSKALIVDFWLGNHTVDKRLYGTTPCLAARLALFALFACGWLWAADRNLAMTFQVRLESQLSSFTPAGTAFDATVISPLIVDGQVMIPSHSIVHGTVRKAAPVGLGVRRERAVIELEFHDYQLPGGETHDLDFQLQSIDNSREVVDKSGRINGALVADAPHKFLWGIWYWPSDTFWVHSPLGLTGASGLIFTRYAMGPFGAAGLMATRYLAFPLPDPEINLPAGTEIRLRALAVPDGPATAPDPEGELDDSVVSRLRDAPAQVLKPDGKNGGDLINLAFVGDREELRNAFAAAGWLPADPLNKYTFTRFARAFSTMGNYPTAPVSTLLYRGSEPALVFQKSFNTIARRHHIRLWNATESKPLALDGAGATDDRMIWLGAATHDTGLTATAISTILTHTVDPHLDVERNKVVEDLKFAGCVDSVSHLDRPELARQAQKEPGMITDGQLVVIELKPCFPGISNEPLQAPPSRSTAAMIIRRVMLETRQYVFRDNIYYTVRTLLQRRAALRADRSGDDPIKSPAAAPVQLASGAGAGASPAAMAK